MSNLLKTRQIKALSTTAQGVVLVGLQVYDGKGVNRPEYSQENTELMPTVGIPQGARMPTVGIPESSMRTVGIYSANSSHYDRWMKTPKKTAKPPAKTCDRIPFFLHELAAHVPNCAECSKVIKHWVYSQAGKGRSAAKTAAAQQAAAARWAGHVKPLIVADGDFHVTIED